MIDIVAVGGTEVTDSDPAASSSPADDSAPDEKPTGGFSTADEFIGAGSAHKSPAMSSAAATFMLRYETSPERREHLGRFRRGALAWFGVAVTAAIIALIVVLSIVKSHEHEGGSARVSVPSTQAPSGP